MSGLKNMLALTAPVDPTRTVPPISHNGNYLESAYSSPNGTTSHTCLGLGIVRSGQSCVSTKVLKMAPFDFLNAEQHPSSQCDV